MWVDAEEYEYLKGRDDRLTHLEELGEELLDRAIAGDGI